MRPLTIVLSFLWSGGYGFQTAPAASNLLKDLIIGQTSELDQKLFQICYQTDLIILTNNKGVEVLLTRSEINH